MWRGITAGSTTGGDAIFGKQKSKKAVLTPAPCSPPRYSSYCPCRSACPRPRALFRSSRGNVRWPSRGRACCSAPPAGKCITGATPPTSTCSARSRSRRAKRMGRSSGGGEGDPAVAEMRRKRAGRRRKGGEARLGGGRGGG